MKTLFSFKREDYKIQQTTICNLHTDYIPATDPNAKKILVLHGAGGSSIPYFPLLALLSEYGYSVYAPNLPGHGKNPHISLKNVHVWDYVDDMIPICNEIKPDILIGHSMGSIIVQKLATIYPAQALILMSAIPPIAVPWKIGKPFIRYFYGILYCIPYFLGFHEPINRAFDKHFIFTHTPLQTVQNLVAANQLDNHLGKETPHLFFDVFNKKFTRIQPNDITCPIMVCTGELDFLMKYETEVHIAEYYKAEFYAQPRSGHFFTIEDGIKKTTQKIQDFLERSFSK